MALKKEQHFFKGMQRDLSVSKFNPEYAFDAQNIRITAISISKGVVKFKLHLASGYVFFKISIISITIFLFIRKPFYNNHK